MVSDAGSSREPDEAPIGAQLEPAPQRGGKAQQGYKTGEQPVVPLDQLVVLQAGQQVPVAVTLYKQHARARIQILTHALSPTQVERLQDEIAMAIDGRIVDRSDLSGVALLKEPTPRDTNVRAKDRVPKPNPPESLPPRS